jgi:hypothetical protein
MLEVRKEFEWTKIGSWTKVNPFTVVFVYPAKEKPFVIKGGLQDCERWLENNMANKNYVYNYQMYHEGRCRGSWKVHFTNPSLRGYMTDNRDWRSPKVHQRGFKLEVRNETMRKNVFSKVVKRIPRCFPKEFLEYC